MQATEGMKSSEFGLSGVWLTALVTGYIPEHAVLPSALLVAVYASWRGLYKVTR